MILNVPIVIQKNSMDCSVASALMVLKYLNKDVDYDFLSKSIKRNKWGKVNIFDLANLLGRLNLKVNILFFNYIYFDDSFNCKNINLKDYNENDPFLRTVKSIKESCNERINIQHRIFFINDIKELIDKGFPIVTLISLGEFRKKRYYPWRGHFIVIKGYKDDKFYVNDPYYKLENNEIIIDEKHLITSIFKVMFPAILWLDKKQ